MTSFGPRMMFEEYLEVPLVGGTEPVETPPGIALGSGLKVVVEGAEVGGEVSKDILVHMVAGQEETRKLSP